MGLLTVLACNAQHDDGPQPTVVTAGKLPGQPPSDALILFDGKDIAQWVYKDGRPASWPIVNGVLNVKERYRQYLYPSEIRQRPDSRRILDAGNAQCTWTGSRE